MSFKAGELGFAPPPAGQQHTLQSCNVGCRHTGKTYLFINKALYFGVYYNISL